MTVTVFPSRLSGVVPAIASKSVLHRLLICSALSDGETRIDNVTMSKDIAATISAAAGLGKSVTFCDGSLYVRDGVRSEVINVNESGSTFRFILPVAAAVSNGAFLTVNGSDYLASRPISPLYEQLVAHGAVLSEKGRFPMRIDGKLSSGEYTLPGNISSQFISGLLFALPLCDGDSRIIIEGKLESKPYIDITVGCLKEFGISIERTEDGYFVRGGQKYVSPGVTECEGDCSNAAFFLAAGALSDNFTGVSGLKASTAQGDVAVIELLERFGAEKRDGDGCVEFRGAALNAIDIDASDIPDLVPILSLVASVASGETTIYGASRLRLKESNRLFSVSDVLSRLGASITETADGLSIVGVERLHGGRVSAHNDHRIAMTAAIASLVSDGEIVIDGFEAINKSYPDFIRDFTAVGGNLEITDAN